MNYKEKINLLSSKIFRVSNASFDSIALQVFKLQSEFNPIYDQFLSYLTINEKTIENIYQVPFLPIQFFKTHSIITGSQKSKIIFNSSGTTGTSRSRHLVTDLSIYEKSMELGFNHFYGNLKKYCFIALLPSYQEQKKSSLIYMVDHFIKNSDYEGRFYSLMEFNLLIEKLSELNNSKIPTIFIGVSYALLRFADTINQNLSNIIFMETGGMKGREKEITRSELHESLKSSFHLKHVHSEYGMTELLSQAYSKGNGIYKTPPWMKVIVKDIYDPMKILPFGNTGALNIIDLANINSCSFIATQDLGRVYEDGSFEVLGRLDTSELRGCNLLLI